MQGEAAVLCMWMGPPASGAPWSTTRIWGCWALYNPASSSRWSSSQAGVAMALKGGRGPAAGACSRNALRRRGETQAAACGCYGGAWDASGDPRAPGITATGCYKAFGVAREPRGPAPALLGVFATRELPGAGCSARLLGSKRAKILCLAYIIALSAPRWCGEGLGRRGRRACGRAVRGVGATVRPPPARLPAAQGPARCETPHRWSCSAAGGLRPGAGAVGA